MASRDQLGESRRQDIAKDLAQAPERRQGRAGLGELIVAVRTAVQQNADWPGTACAVAAEFERWLSPDVLAPDERDDEPFVLDEANGYLVQAGTSVSRAGT